MQETVKSVRQVTSPPPRDLVNVINAHQVTNLHLIEQLVILAVQVNSPKMELLVNHVNPDQSVPTVELPNVNPVHQDMETPLILLFAVFAVLDLIPISAKLVDRADQERCQMQEDLVFNAPLDEVTLVQLMCAVLALQEQAQK